MYQYVWDVETGGILLTNEQVRMSKEPRPVYYRELDILGFDKYWNYPKDDSAPFMWVETGNYIYRGRTVAKTRGGSLYTPPEIIIEDEPEKDGRPLRFVDIKRMTEKNSELMNALAQETIRDVYNTYQQYKNKVDVFYVAFSGGKDSVVALDIVQRALPHDDFLVIFGDTGMEFPDTINLVKEVKRLCKSENIEFHVASAKFSAEQSWKIFGAPARKLRWCCTVHKTAPVINKLNSMFKLNRLKTIMITGVRADESLKRASYKKFSLGKKMAGQYSYHPILDWSSAEIYLYIYAHNLIMNNAYKNGFGRVGCVMCPNSSSKHEFLKRQLFPSEVDKFCDIITDNSKKDLSGNNKRLFLENGGWKMRLSGRELKISEEERVVFEEQKKKLKFTVINLRDEWKEWYKTVGEIDEKHDGYTLEYDGVWRKCIIKQQGNESIFDVENLERNKNSIEFVYYFKRVLIKAQYCIRCEACMAECSHRSIIMKDGKISITDDCIRCHACLAIESGCLYYKSIKGSTGMIKLKGVNRYLSIGVNAEWVKEYAKDQSYEPGNRRTDTMFYFMSDGNMTSKRKLTDFGRLVIKLGLGKDSTWALIACNLVYTPAFNWLVRNINFDERYNEKNLVIDMEGVTSKAQHEFWNGFKIILDSNKSLQDIGLGVPDITEKKLKNGDTQKSMNAIIRSPWLNPDPRVVLYSLYKFAEACDGYYQFTLATLMDDSIEREGISPTRIFGLDRDTMVGILNGLSVNYPAFISASFSLDLDSITLYAEKSSSDVLALFE